MKLTNTYISFLRDIHSSINVDMTSGWRHHYFDDFSLDDLSSFIKQIEDGQIFLVIPLFAADRSNSLPTMVLSEPFLINNKSNYVLITKFILQQWDKSGFKILEGTKIYFSFKFKRVWLSEK